MLESLACSLPGVFISTDLAVFTEQLVSRKVEASEKEAWEFAAIANRLAQANGAYRADTGGHCCL